MNLGLAAILTTIWAHDHMLQSYVYLSRCSLDGSVRSSRRERYKTGDRWGPFTSLARRKVFVTTPSRTKQDIVGLFKKSQKGKPVTSHGKLVCDVPPISWSSYGGEIVLRREEITQIYRLFIHRIHLDCSQLHRLRVL